MSLLFALQSFHYFIFLRVFLGCTFKIPFGTQSIPNANKYFYLFERKCGSTCCDDNKLRQQSESFMIPYND